MRCMCNEIIKHIVLAQHARVYVHYLYGIFENLKIHGNSSKQINNLRIFRTIFRGDPLEYSFNTISYRGVCGFAILGIPRWVG